MAERDKPLAWLSGEVKTPPFSAAARVEAGALLRRLQQGESLGLPHSRPMSVIGRRCHELRIVDADATWRIMYHIAAEAIVILMSSERRPGQHPNDASTRHDGWLAAYYAALKEE
jgi:phage-related protein